MAPFRFPTHSNKLWFHIYHEIAVMSAKFSVNLINSYTVTSCKTMDHCLALYDALTTTGGSRTCCRGRQMASAEREPITGVWGRSPLRRSRGQSPRWEIRGAKPPWNWKVFCFSVCHRSAKFDPFGVKLCSLDRHPKRGSSPPPS